MNRLTTRIMVRRAWDKCYLLGWIDGNQSDAGHTLLRGRGEKSVKALAECEEKFVGYAKRLGYKGATSYAKRNIRGILTWLLSRLKEVDWIALAKFILPIILMFL